MLTIPTAMWPYLHSQAFRPVEVYEIEAFAGRATLYYSDQNITWNGNNYVGLAVERTPITNTMSFKVPDCRITFSNVQKTLVQYLIPTDTLTGARVTVRLLLRDAANAVLTDSLILFRGTIEPPSHITDEEFTLSVVGLISGRGVVLPARRMSAPCPWQFANGGLFDGGGECAYQSTTTAAAGGTATSNLTLTSAATFKNGDFIKVGGNAEVQILSGGGTTFLGLSAQGTWSIGAAVRFSQCNRSRSDCTSRAMLFRYGGFPAAGSISREVIRRKLITGIFKPKIISIDTGQFVRRAGDEFSDPTAPVPILFGRRRIAPVMMELSTNSFPVQAALARILFYALSEGPIDDNGGSLPFYYDDTLRVDKLNLGDKVFGLYFRVGGFGVNDSETVPEYVADPSTQLRAQNVDYASSAQIAYSSLAYVIFQQSTNNSLEPIGSVDSPPNFEIDAKGIKVVAYDAAGTPSTAAWSVSPIWQAVFVALSGKLGIGLNTSDIDFAVAKDSADYASPLITSTEASTTVTTAQGTASTVCKVNSAEGFVAGRRIDVNGVANTLVRIVAYNELKLGTAVTQSIGHTVVQRPQRFESHLYISQTQRAIWVFETLMASCRGYITYDAGKVQFRIERDTVTDRLLDGGFETWTSATNLTNWGETIGSEGTVNRESAGVHGGSFAVRIDRTNGSQFIGVGQSVTGLAPGRWYRVNFWHKQSAQGSTALMTNACSLQVQNTTASLLCSSDGVTWVASAVAVQLQGELVWTQFEFVFKTRETFAPTDTYQILLAPYFGLTGQGTQSVWYDDVTLRGPYAGDYREFTAANLMGWIDGSFVWSLDKKDRETNRVVVEYVSESFLFGPQEAAADDFTHQQTHQIRSLKIQCEAIADADQASRIAKFELAKRRMHGPGCEFVGTPAALALQPGDVILVSESVPGWTRKEQRVIETEILGRGDNDEHFVVVRTEDYLEAVYSDVGSPQNSTPVRPTPAIVVNIVRNNGGVLELAWVADANMPSVRRFRIHMSDATGFTADETNKIGETVASVFSYTMRQSDLDKPRYFFVIGVTDSGEISSDEFAVTVYVNPGTASGYSDNFKFPATKGTVAGLTAFTGAIGDVTDASDATSNAGTATSVGGTAQNDNDGVLYSAFGITGTKTGRPYVRAGLSSSGGPYGTFKLYYSTNGGSSWNLFQTVTSASPADYFGPEVSGMTSALFQIKAEVRMVNGGFINRTTTGANYRVAFDEKA